MGRDPQFQTLLEVALDNIDFNSSIIFLLVHIFFCFCFSAERIMCFSGPGGVSMCAHVNVYHSDRVIEYVCSIN